MKWPWSKKQTRPSGPRDPDDVDHKRYVRDLPSLRPKKVWVACCDGEVMGPVDVKFFKNGRVIVKVYSKWMEVYPDGRGTSFIKEWWSDELRES